MKASYLKPLLPLRDIVIFPSMVVPLFVGREKSIKALQEATKTDKSIILVAQKNSETDDPVEKDLFSFGCMSKILQLLKLPDGTVKVLVEGQKRVKILNIKNETNYLNCDVEIADDTNTSKDLDRFVDDETAYFQFIDFIYRKYLTPKQTYNFGFQRDDLYKHYDFHHNHSIQELFDKMKNYTRSQNSDLFHNKTHNDLVYYIYSICDYDDKMINDDVVDNSKLRRGKRSVNDLWSNSHSVLIGDYIYSKAFKLMTQLEDFRILDELANATNDISKGELVQLNAINNLQLDLKELLRISYLKTGRLFEASAKCGAMLCTDNIKYIKLISESSRDIGTLFQIRDDLLDYGHNISKNFNKPIFQDIREGKITYPLLFAYKNSNRPDKKSLSSFLGKQDIDEKKLKQIIIKNKGIEMSVDLANTFHDQIIRKIKLINNKLIEKEMLELLSFALIRSK